MEPDGNDKTACAFTSFKASSCTEKDAYFCVLWDIMQVGKSSQNNVWQYYIVQVLQKAR